MGTDWQTWAPPCRRPHLWAEAPLPRIPVLGASKEVFKRVFNSVGLKPPKERNFTPFALTWELTGPQKLWHTEMCEFKK